MKNNFVAKHSGIHKGGAHKSEMDYTRDFDYDPELVEEGMFHAGWFSNFTGEKVCPFSTMAEERTYCPTYDDYLIFSQKVVKND